MKNLLCFVIPYFGRFPDYFQIFLKSCELNKDYNWIIITDNELTNTPDNVKVIQISFEQLKNHVQSRFSFSISLDNPKKLCDYKPAYGYIFDQELKKL